MFFFFDIENLDKQDENYDQLLLLNSLIERFEHELVEFKEAGNDYDKNKIGQYVSAISNEANLKGQQFGWLIFGVRNKDRKIVGSDYRLKSGLDKLKQEIAIGTNGVTFLEIFELFPVVDGEQKRVLMFQIPAAPTSIPTQWQGHWYARNGESLTPLAIHKLDKIRDQHKKDWSKQIVETATIEHLDKEAIEIARANYKKRMNKPHINEEVDKMSDKEFLVKLKLIINEGVTNAAMVLLGSGDYDYLIESPPQMMWRLYGTAGEDKDYEIFTIPFIKVVDKIFAKIRNLTYRYMPNQLTLFPTDTQQYDPWLLRELMNNCIAHMDYTAGNRIYVNELEDRIKFTNPGSFLPGEIKPVLEPSYNPPFYRNQLLAETMMNFHMIDTAAMGIRKVFRIQRDKFFPLPDYDLSVSKQVSVVIHGKVLNENYTRVLFDNPSFDLNTVYLIDRVQKNEAITKDELKELRKLGVVEGKLPNIYISATVAEIVGEKAQYIKNKAFDEKYYRELIIEYLKQFHKASRDDVRRLLLDKLPDSLDVKQKENKIRNLLHSMNQQGLIERDGSNHRTSKWQLTTNQ